MMQAISTLVLLIALTNIAWFVLLVTATLMFNLIDKIEEKLRSKK